MKFSVIVAPELGPKERAIWSSLQSANEALESPYFCPDFTLAVAAIRNDVRVTVMEDGAEVVGYFPFQRGGILGAGRPVGGPLSDYHGVVAHAERTFSVEDLLRESRLGYWEFDHLVAHQAPFAPFHRARAVSPALDLSRGFAAYRRRRLEAGSGRLAQIERKARKLAREIGPVRFEPETRDRKVLEWVFAMKSAQCRGTGVLDFFAFPWARELVEQILAMQSASFAGVLSALYAGDHLVAAHMGMRSERVWHWWFPVYNHEFSRYSPGGILLLELAEHAADRGHVLLDLGKGDDAYKTSFADYEVPLAEGCATRCSVGTFARHARKTTEKALRASPLLEPLRPALRQINRWIRHQSYA